MRNHITGGCLCGAVRYQAKPPTLFCAHCHCGYCRRAHGAAFVTWFGVPEEAFQLSSGEDVVRWHESSKQSRRGFCTVCGTTLFFASTIAPGEMHVALATADGPIDRAPQAHVFSDHRVPWIGIADELPCYTSDSEQLAKYRAVPGAPIPNTGD